MARENILEAIGDIAREKGINRDRLVAVIQEAVTAAAKRKFKNFQDIEARLNPKTGELEVFRYKKVTEAYTDADNEIALDDALTVNLAGERIQVPLDAIRSARLDPDLKR